MFALIDETFEAELSDPQARKRWLVLDRHPDFHGHWIVEGFSSDYLFDLGEILGSYRALAPAGLERFLEAAEDHGYKVAFFEDPVNALEQFEHLNREPEIAIHSSFENTVHGLLPYQVQGYNMLKDLDYGIARWDTGTGKTVLASALVQYHEMKEHFDLCFFVVKKNNKINTVRKLEQLASVHAIAVAGPKPKREQYYTYINSLLAKGVRTVVVLNYEQFKHDFVQRDSEGKLDLTEWGETFFPNRDLLFIWDEMPTKLKTRTSELYRSICKCLYRTAPPQVNYQQLRPKSMRAYMLSATPIENSPEDWFDCVRLLDGGRTYGTVSDFNNIYVKSWNFYEPTRPQEFHNLERMRLKAAHVVHQVNKDDPSIAAIFPKSISETVWIDWNDSNSRLYSLIQAQAEGVTEQEPFTSVPIFSLITTLQMMCDAPEMITDSAARREAWRDDHASWEESPIGRAPPVDGSEFALTVANALSDRLTNKNHPKIEKLREILLERHPSDQVALYTRFNSALMPYLKAALEEWNVSYGHYAGTERQQQAVQDAFQAGEIRVFLASDSGSDSIDLESGSVVIDYDLPWKWTTVTQRHNRVHRPNSLHKTVYYYVLLMAGSVEERVLRIIEKKRGYHVALFDPAAGDFSASARLTKEDLLYILTGH